MRTDPETVQAQKASLRRGSRLRLEALPEQWRAEASRQACERLARQSIWSEAATVLFYAPMGPELDVWPLVAEALANGKQVLLPRFTEASQTYQACRIADLAGDIAPGKFGIRESASHCEVLALNRLDLVLVPGLAFDPHGRRLGRGKGFYDRLLSAVRGVRCGVAFDEQLLPEVPAEPHDVLLNCILTPTRWIEL
jgi:5-formyltetrahydrofolate cyclo-ligase